MYLSILASDMYARILDQDFEGEFLLFLVLGIVFRQRGSIYI
jgi:hypothetical protein